jgi:calcineurin-like phosphoesterase family protein
MIKIEVDSKNVPLQNVWITSDTHYSHKNICRGTTEWRTEDGQIPISQTRDFATIEKMNASIVNNINEVVGQDDILIHLGDWSFGGFEKIREFWDRIICKNIHLVLGNHDHHIENN